MELPDLESTLDFLEHVIIGFIPQSGNCNLGTGEFGKWVEIQSVNNICDAIQQNEEDYGSQPGQFEGPNLRNCGLYSCVYEGIR